jgi:DNA-binding transcriptional regulator PaaX
LRYNQLKEMILRALSELGEETSLGLMERLRGEGAAISEKALQMALLRYYRQGLLSRRRRKGLYRYSLTDKGRRRLEWLKGRSP